MRWEEEADNGAATPRAGVVDIVFRLSGRWLPVEHAAALRDAIVPVLPWLEDEPGAGIHSIHGAASGNGWERPRSEPGAVLTLSRRTRLAIRTPVGRVEAAEALCGRRLDIGGYGLAVEGRQLRRLTPAQTLFARSVADEEDGGEERFVERIAQELEAHSVPARKLLCGRVHRIGTTNGALTARSLLIADLGGEESLALQCRGVGPGRLLGCGLFVPHKDIGPVRRMGDGSG